MSVFEQNRDKAQRQVTKLRADLDMIRENIRKAEERALSAMRQSWEIHETNVRRELADALVALSVWQAMVDAEGQDCNCPECQ